MNPDTHCVEINRCNQRRGRMLSVIDLIRAGTLDYESASYCCAAVRKGTSFLVGARPGGAGKTTVMCALLNFVPDDVALTAADGFRTLEEGLSPKSPKSCYVCHEIGAGPYYAYLWDEEARLFFRLPASGQMIATNLHTDTFEETYEQLCITNRVPEGDFHQVGLHLYLAVQGGWARARRRIHAIHEVLPGGERSLIYGLDKRNDTLRRQADSQRVSEDEMAAQRELLERLEKEGLLTIEEVRREVLASD